MSNEITSTTKIRFGDCDPLGHLNNVKYLEYMLNAREDHVESFYGFTYEDYIKKTGCYWVTIQNEIAYLKEVRANVEVKISSKTIEINDRISKVEILMTNLEGTIVHAVLWITVIYFDLKKRQSTAHPEEVIELFNKHLVTLEQKDFHSRAAVLRRANKIS